MATQIRAIPTLYGDTASDFELQATMTEQNPGTEDYRREAEVVSQYLVSLCNPLKYARPLEAIPQPTEIIERDENGNVKVIKIGSQKDVLKSCGSPIAQSRRRRQELAEV